MPAQSAVTACKAVGPCQAKPVVLELCLCMHVLLALAK